MTSVKAFERQLIEILLVEPSLLPVALRTIPPDCIALAGLRWIYDEMDELFRITGEPPALDAIKARLKNRVDLVDACNKLAEVGNVMNNRDQWQERIVEQFNSIASQDPLAVELDDAGALELMTQLQSRMY